MRRRFVRDGRDGGVMPAARQCPRDDGGVAPTVPRGGALAPTVPHALRGGGLAPTARRRARIGSGVLPEMRRVLRGGVLGAAMALALLAPGIALAQGSDGAGAGGPAGSAFTPEQRQEIVAILREALLRDPSILRDAVAALEEAEARDHGSRARAAIAQHAEALFRDPADPVKGNPRGDVTIVEFFDARCGYCRQLHPAMEQLLRRDRNVRLVLKDLPILGPNSMLAARALLAAQRQGKYAELQDALLRLRGDTPEGVLRAEAEKLGLDWARLRREMDDPAIQRRIEGNLRLARTLGIEGTPAMVIGEALIPGAIDLPTLERVVAEARQAGAVAARR